MKYIFLLSIAFQANANDLVEAAKERLNHVVFYDGAYQSIAYPMGDVDKNKGVCTDVIVRSYRTLGIDLQQLVHEDMALNFKNYPKIWGLKKPDSNIDHRRVPNLETFFSRFGTKLPMTKNPDIYQPGDIVTWRLTGSNLPHIGIVSDEKADTGNFKIIHNIGLGPQINDMLFDHPIVGHFHYPNKQ
jgi:hypothetical protein